MATTSATKAAFSRYGKAPQAIIDADSASDRLAYKILTFPLYYSTAAGAANAGYFVINTTKKHSLGPVGIPGYVRDCYVTFSTIPAGGTLSHKLVAYDASANAEVVLTAAPNPEAATAREGQQLAPTTTNILLAADDNLEYHAVASNDTVTQDAVEVRVTVVFQPVEASPPTITSGVG